MYGNPDKCVVQTSKVSKGFLTSFFREKCQEDKGMLVGSFRLNPFKNELD